MDRLRQLIKLPVLVAVTVAVVLLQNYLLPDEPVNPTSVAATPLPNPIASPTPSPESAPEVTPAPALEVAPASDASAAAGGAAAVPPAGTVPAPVPIQPQPPLPPPPELPGLLPPLVECDPGLVGGLLGLTGVCR